MGNTSSTTSSSLRGIENDFELVIRASKDMEQWLKNNLQVNNNSSRSNNNNVTAPDETKIQHLFKMIDEAKDQEIVSKETAALMKKLGYWRNCLVHDTKFNSLSACGTTRHDFISLYENVKKELDSNYCLQRIDEYGYPFTTEQMTRRSTSSLPRTSLLSEEEGSPSFGLFAALALAGLAASAVIASNEEEEKERRRRRW